MRRTAVWNSWSSRFHAGPAPGSCASTPGLPGPGADFSAASRPHSGTLRALLLLLVLPASLTMATTVYRSTGSDGETVFSDQPPESGTSVRVIRLPASPAATDAGAHLQDIREVTERMISTRQAREAARAEASGPLIIHTTPPPEARPPENIGLQPHGLWPSPFIRLPYRGPGRPYARPGGESPQVPPGYRVLQPGNQQLMRPIISSRD